MVSFQIGLKLLDVLNQLVITFINIFKQMGSFLHIIRCQIRINIPLDLFIILFHITPEHHCGKVCITDLITFFYGASKVADAVSKIDPKNHDQYQVHQAQLCCNPAPK